jgi:F0F1-type ATP synthase membrane subunit b/b'
VGVLHQIGIRWQLVLAQLVGFLLMYFLVLKPLLFGRIQRVLDERAAEEARRKAGIASGRKETDAVRAKLEARRAEVEKQAYEKTQAEVREGQKRKSEVISTAMDWAREEVGASRKKVAEARAEAIGRFEKDVVSLTLFLAQTLTGNKVAPAVESAATREVSALVETRVQGKKA